MLSNPDQNSSTARLFVGSGLQLSSSRSSWDRIIAGSLLWSNHPARSATSVETGHQRGLPQTWSRMKEQVLKFAPRSIRNSGSSQIWGLLSQLTPNFVTRVHALHAFVSYVSKYGDAGFALGFPLKPEKGFLKPKKIKQCETTPRLHWRALLEDQSMRSCGLQEHCQPPDVLLVHLARKPRGQQIVEAS